MKITYRTLTKNDEGFLSDMLVIAAHLENNNYSLIEVKSHPTLSSYVKDWGKNNDIGFMAIDPKDTHPIGAVWMRLYTQKQ